jgi:chromate transport protein ChrA
VRDGQAANRNRWSAEVILGYRPWKPVSLLLTSLYVSRANYEDPLDDRPARRAEQPARPEGFVAALEISQAMPGLNATNMSVIVGDRLRGGLGALVAFLGMFLPGTAIVLALGVLYGAHGHKPAVTGILDGVNAAAVGLLLAVTLQIGRRQVGGAMDVVLAVATCVAVSVLHLSLVPVLATIGPLAVWLYRPRGPEPRP